MFQVTKTTTSSDVSAPKKNFVPQKEKEDDCIVLVSSVEKQVRDLGKLEIFFCRDLLPNQKMQQTNV